MGLTESLMVLAATCTVLAGLFALAAVLLEVW